MNSKFCQWANSDQGSVPTTSGDTQVFANHGGECLTNPEAVIIKAHTSGAYLSNITWDN